MTADSKRIMKLFLFLSAVILLNLSCSKTATTIVNPTSTAAGTLSCKINNASFSPTYITPSYQYIQLMVVGSSGDFLTKIDFTAIVSANVGTYDLKNNANYTLNKVISPAVYGTLNLTKFDATLHLVSGTFSYTTKDSTRITEGVFTDLNY